MERVAEEEGCESLPEGEGGWRGEEMEEEGEEVEAVV